MATRFRSESPVLYSVLDRLINDEKDYVGGKYPTDRYRSVQNFKAFVRRDLEWLLNSRAPLEEAHGPETEKSLYMYGLPDITSLSLSNPADRKKLTRAIQEVVATFEPRISNPKVTLSNTSDNRSRTVRFVIEGTLRMDPNPEPVAFDTVLDLSNGEYKLPGESSAR